MRKGKSNIWRKYAYVKRTPEEALKRALDKVKRREQFVARRARIEESQRKPEEDWL